MESFPKGLDTHSLSVILSASCIYLFLPYFLFSIMTCLVVDDFPSGPVGLCLSFIADNGYLRHQTQLHTPSIVLVPEHVLRQPALSRGPVPMCSLHTAQSAQLS